MSISSLDAPKFSLEDVKREREALTSDEMEDVTRDIQGDIVGGPYEETPAMIEVALRQFDEAMELILDTDKAAYLEAVRVAPHIVEREANPLLFLRCERFDCWAAALRVTKYWKVRRRIFGERAFLPMSLTGNGALQQREIDFLRIGAVAMLANDKLGRPIIWQESPRSYGTRDRSDNMIRCTFYVLTAASLERDASIKGLVAVCFNVHARAELSNRRTIRVLLEIANCIPAKVNVLHYISGSSGFYNTYMRPAIFYLLGKRLRLRTILHNSSREETLLSLEKSGVNRLNLPSWAGGQWEINDLIHWIDVRRARDIELEGSRGVE